MFCYCEFHCGSCATLAATEEQCTAYDQATDSVEESNRSEAPTFFSSFTIDSYICAVWPPIPEYLTDLLYGRGHGAPAPNADDTGVVQPVERVDMDTLCVLIPGHHVSRLGISTKTEEMVDMVKEQTVSEGLRDTGIQVSCFRITIEGLGQLTQNARPREITPSILNRIRVLCYPIDCIVLKT